MNPSNAFREELELTLTYIVIAIALVLGIVYG